jgi:hypothetical protein
MTYNVLENKAFFCILISIRNGQNLGPIHHHPFYPHHSPHNWSFTSSLSGLLAPTVHFLSAAAKFPCEFGENLKIWGA